MNRTSFLWSAVRNWGPRIGTILTFFVLARILDKTEIGMFAAAYALISFMELFADNGFGDAIVRTRNVTAGLATTILLLNVGIAVLIYLAMIALAPEVGSVMGVEGIEPILSLVGLSLVMNSIGYVPQALLRKNFEFKRLAFRSLASTIAGAATGLAMAFGGFGVYSMVGQLLVTTLVNVIFLWIPMVLRPAAPEVKGVGDILPFAARVFGSRVLSYMSLRLIEIVIPIFFGPAALALYIMGSRVPAVLAQMLTAVMVDVNLPRFSQLADRPDELKSTYYSSLGAFCALSLPAFLGIAALSPEISQLAFGRNGAGTEYLMFLIAILGALQSIGYSNEVFLNAWGLPQIVLRIQIAATVLVAACFFVFRNTSVDALVTAYVCCHILAISCGILYGTHKVGFSISRIFSAVGPSLISSIGALAAVYFLRSILNTRIDFLLAEAALLGIIFAFAYIILLFIIDRKALLATFRHFLRHPKATPNKEILGERGNVERDDGGL